MDHHRRVHAGERAAVEEVHFAAAAFFGRRPDHGDGEPELVDERRQRQARADRGRGDDVVTARMTDSGERVVLRADREMQRPISEPTGEGGREFADTRFDRESGIGQQTGRPCARPLLLELQLGEGVDSMTQPDERRFVF